MINSVQVWSIILAERNLRHKNTERIMAAADASDLRSDKNIINEVCEDGPAALSSNLTDILDIWKFLNSCSVKAGCAIVPELGNDSGDAGIPLRGIRN